MSGHTLRESGCLRARIPARINLCDYAGCQRGKESVSVWRKCRSSLGHVDGGGGTSEAPGPHGTSLPSPPDRLGASGLCQRLWPPQTPIYMTGERSGLDQGEGKI